MITKEQMITALAAILDEIERVESSLPPATEIGLISTAELVDRDWTLHEYARDPVGQALRRGVEEIGRRGAPFFTLDELGEIAEAAAFKRGHWGLRIDIIDKRWDGAAAKDGVWAA